MKYFQKENNNTGYGNEAVKFEAIRLNNIFSVSVTDENKINIMEECEGYYEKEFTKEDAIAMFEEAIEWIKSL